MKVVFFSSVFNHHSMPFCDAMYRLCKGEFIFVQTMREEAQRIELGYHSDKRPYVINMLESEETKNKAAEIAISADIMIAGVFPYEILKARLKMKKPTFLCQERMFKGGDSLIKRLRSWWYAFRKYQKYKKWLYLLSIGEGAAEDYRKIGFFKGKSYKWGYFPQVQFEDEETLFAKKPKNTVQVLFAGRLISLKNPQYVLKAVASLIEQGENVHLKYIGCGEMLQTLQDLAEELKITDRVDFMGAMPPEKVAEEMRCANIFAFTSNSLEGWGAVVNEAMGAGCAIIASSSAGSVSTLIRNEQNGMIYENDNYQDFFKKLSLLVKNKKMAKTFGISAVRTIKEEYNAEIAAMRFLHICEMILNGEEIQPYKEGLMSLL